MNNRNVRTASAEPVGRLWQQLDPQVRYRLVRMKRELDSVPGRVKRHVQEAEVPVFRKKTKELQMQLKDLKSQREKIEGEIPYIINLVRAQKTPEDAFTRCWDPSTGIKMKVKDIEKMLSDLEAKIAAVAAPKAHEEHMSLIYIRMRERYKSGTAQTTKHMKDLRFRIKQCKW